MLAAGRHMELGTGVSTTVRSGPNAWYVSGLRSARSSRQRAMSYRHRARDERGRGVDSDVLAGSLRGGR